MTPEVETHPVQTVDRRGGKISKSVTMAAYEVYCHVYGPQEALITNNYRGGFSTGELIAFLYAKPFPKTDWAKRVNEALESMEHL